jgi:hypothetical protein
MARFRRQNKMKSKNKGGAEMHFLFFFFFSCFCWRVEKRAVLRFWGDDCVCDGRGQTKTTKSKNKTGFSFFV